MFDLEFEPLDSSDVSDMGDKGYSHTGFTVLLKRNPTPYYISTFLPTGLLTILSYCGFMIPVDKVPGRMALLVTIFTSGFCLLVYKYSLQKGEGGADNES